MPRAYCVVYGCFNSALKKPELSYFKLPADFKRRFQWVRLIAREDLMNKAPQNYTVCEEHFNAMDILTGNHRKRLKTNSFPSLHLPDLQNKDVSRNVNRRSEVGRNLCRGRIKCNTFSE